MALRIRSLFGTPVRATERADSSSRDASAAPADDSAYPPGSMREAEPDAPALERALRREADRRAEVLRSRPDADQAAQALLEDLQGDLQSVVRRPPAAIHRAMEACRDPDASLERIAETFKRDPALAQALLKHANSPFYAANGLGCGSLTDAAQRVGLSGLNSVLMASLVESMVTQPGGELGTMVQQVWTHLVRTAPIARRLGSVTRLAPERCFTLGLLHDFGKLIIIERVATLLASSGAAPALDFVGRALVELHGPLGGLAALSWNLDPVDARAVAAHDRRDLRYANDGMAEVLCVAEWADLTEIREESRDYESFWSRATLSIPLEACRQVLEG